MDEVRRKLQGELDVVDWQTLRGHLHQDSVILVDSELDLVEVAWCVAGDRTTDVAAWIGAGLLRKPAREELADWEREMEKPFRMLIIAPFVLVQAA